MADLEQRRIGSIRFHTELLAAAVEALGESNPISADRLLMPARWNWNGDDKITEAELQQYWVTSKRCPPSMYYIRGDDLERATEPRSAKRLKKLQAMIVADLLGRA